MTVLFTQLARNDIDAAIRLRPSRAQMRAMDTQSKVDIRSGGTSEVACRRQIIRLRSQCLVMPLVVYGARHARADVE